MSDVFISKWCKHPDNELTDTLTRLFEQFWLEKRNPSLERITEWKKKEKLIKVAGGRKHNIFFSMCKVVQCLNNTGAVFLVFSYILNLLHPSKATAFPAQGIPPVPNHVAVLCCEQMRTGEINSSFWVMI